MKIVIAIMLACLASTAATAQTTCTRIGDTVICSGPGGSTTCTRIGDTVICS